MKPSRPAIVCLAGAVVSACHSVGVPHATLESKPVQCDVATSPLPPTISLQTDIGNLLVPTGWSIWYREIANAPMVVFIPPDGSRFRIVVRSFPSGLYDPKSETMQEFLRLNATTTKWPSTTRAVNLGITPNSSPECIAADTQVDVRAACGVLHGSAVSYAHIYGIPSEVFNEIGGMRLLYDIAVSVQLRPE